MRDIGPLPPQLVRLGSGALDAAFVRFDDHDSGCFSYGIEIDGDRYFVKSSSTANGRSSLINALRFHRAVSHQAIVRPLGASIGEDLKLVYPWIEGAVLNQATIRGSDREGLGRFRALGLSAIEVAIRTVLEAHVHIAAAGFVSVDFYDGAMLYDFSRDSMHLIDLDAYRPAPFIVSGNRLPGSRSYMAPEESVHGAVIDQRTMVFTMGRTIEHLLESNDGHQRRSTAQRELIARSTATNPVDRYDTVFALMQAWDNSLADPEKNGR